jgi:hypothetical protein
MNDIIRMKGKAGNVSRGNNEKGERDRKNPAKV